MHIRIRYNINLNEFSGVFSTLILPQLTVKIAQGAIRSVDILLGDPSAGSASSPPLRRQRCAKSLIATEPRCALVQPPASLHMVRLYTCLHHVTTHLSTLGHYISLVLDLNFSHHIFYYCKHIHDVSKETFV